MRVLRNYLLKGRHKRPITLDMYWEDGDHKKKLVIFCHGFKGFKDWGHWDKIAKSFASVDCCFLKFNFSHNGVTPDDLLNFVDLDAFGLNNYTKELDDLQMVLDWLQVTRGLESLNLDMDDITLIGHSRGGPIALIAAAENNSISKVVTWAGVHELNYAWEKESFELEKWKKEGVYYLLNGRTKQEMPLYYQLYEDYTENAGRFAIKNTLQKLAIPYLIIHGDNDPAVPLDAAHYLHQYAINSRLEILPNANHVFGGSHPFESKKLPTDTQLLIQKTIEFIKSS